MVKTVTLTEGIYYATYDTWEPENGDTNNDNNITVNFYTRDTLDFTRTRWIYNTTEFFLHLFVHGVS